MGAFQNGWELTLLNYNLFIYLFILALILKVAQEIPVKINL